MLRVCFLHLQVTRECVLTHRSRSYADPGRGVMLTRRVLPAAAGRRLVSRSCRLNHTGESI